MHTPQRSISITSKFIGIYSKLLLGIRPEQLDQNGDPEHLISELLDLKVDRGYLSSELKEMSKDCTHHAAKAQYHDIKKVHALETLKVVVDACLAKTLSGWEVMEVLAGSVGKSDQTFTDFTAMLNDVIGDKEAPVDIRYQAVELGLVFVCSISQLSPGAYFLRRNLFPAIVSFINSPNTRQYTSQAILFLAILANYHKSDAARLNPYLRRIKETEDEVMMLRLCDSVNSSLDEALRVYGNSCTSDGSATNLASSLTTAMSLLRPGRLISRVTGYPAANEVEKSQPAESAVALLPLYEFLRGNRLFIRTMLRSMEDEFKVYEAKAPLLVSLLNFASHLFTHGAASSEPRTSSYAGLTLDILLLLVENADSVDVFSTKGLPNVRLCRQRLPKLPTPVPGRFLVCEVLDCCNLWLRHNMNRRLPTQSHSKCIWICHRVVWYLQDSRRRIEYEWKELWMSTLGVLIFISSKFDGLVTTGGIEQLIIDTMSFLATAISGSEIYLPSPHALYELIYELVRNAETLEKQRDLLDTLALPSHPGPRQNEALDYTLEIVNFYREKITAKGTLTKVSDAMKVVVGELEANGLHLPSKRYSVDPEPPLRSEDVLDFGRYACSDGLVLIAGGKT